ncbi:DNA repair protein RecN [Sediminicola luteus]|uniref:DNA repair protein RecN n=1 Tax=Sediminicola luteus TaxID=319238 RepID=A0A2A4G7E6_9FLAO|nr:DNA repair protein RecN [Sediminicola luteus]PCE63672.1 DNA repair protein RecN [Sediminicola luteus]
MLSNLSIRNYALIEKLDMGFDNGFTVITGETGAGKSILLGGLSLVLGKRADLSVLNDPEKKCVIETEFRIGSYGLQSFFETEDLDYEDNTIIRREILPSGKSRAFINDTPVNLSVLQELGARLMDIHSQHQTLELTQNTFQLRLIDALAKTQNELLAYRKALKVWRSLEKELQELLDFQATATQEFEYHSHLLEELLPLDLKDGVVADLESRQEQLANVETIQQNLAEADHLINQEQIGLLDALTQLRQNCQKLAGYGGPFSGLDERVNALSIELDDIEKELTRARDGVETDPRALQETEDKLTQLYALLKKHNCADESELLATRNALEEKVAKVANIQDTIAEKQGQCDLQKEKVLKISEKISKARAKTIKPLTKQLEAILSNLGMPQARFQIGLTPSDHCTETGTDILSFLFSANAGGQFGELKKMASGGELSRIMLAIKSILAQHENLPTIMFDEIDTGVSGHIATQMALIMQQMGQHMQVFSITHLPQVAAKGKTHYMVKKQVKHGKTLTELTLLDPEERVIQLGQMLDGKEPSESALTHARQLLQ